MTPSTASPRPDVLRAIVAGTRRIVERRQTETPREVLEERVAAESSLARGARFYTALSRPDRFNVIAECKRRSPSKGVLCPDYDPVAIARSYEEAGAHAVSVLTEPAFFDGALEHLEHVRQGVRDAAFPLLRKDFIVDEYQVLEAVLCGASAILLIVAALSDDELRHLSRVAERHGMAVLVEVHDGEELARAVAVGTGAIGVNNRSLKTLDVSLDTAFDLVDRIPRDCVAVAESGLRTGDDLVRLRRAGYDAFLIGERFMTAPDPGRALAELVQAADRAWEALA